MTPNRRLAAALLAGLVLLHLVGTLAAYFEKESGYLWIFAYGQCALLGWWVGFSRVRPAWKLVGWCSGTTFLFALGLRWYVRDAARHTPWTWSDWNGYTASEGMMIPIVGPATAALFVAAGWGLRRRGLYFRTPFGRGDRAAAKVELRKWQFGLGDLLLTTFTAAVSLGLIALTAPYRAWMLALPAFWCERLVDFNLDVIHGLIVFDIVLVAFLAAWATLGKRLLSRRLGWVALVAAIWPLFLASIWIATGVYVLGLGRNGDPCLDVGEFCYSWVQWAYRDFFYLFAFLASSFLVVRLAGCRLVREPKKGSELNDPSSGDRTEPDQSA